MIRLSSTAIFFLLSICGCMASNGGVSICEADIPASIWESHHEGVATALILTNSRLTAYVKNTSAKTIAYSRNEGDYGVKIFYLDNQGIKVALHGYYNDTDDETQKMVSDIAIEPGKVVGASFEITPSELALLTSHRVMFSCTIYDPADFRHPTTVESSPKLVTPTK